MDKEYFTVIIKHNKIDNEPQERPLIQTKPVLSMYFKKHFDKKIAPNIKPCDTAGTLILNESWCNNHVTLTVPLIYFIKTYLMFFFMF